MMSYDVIGDVHGEAGKLEALLKALGYVRNGRGWRAPLGRQAVFVGDLIDRGPGQMQVLETVRSMVDGDQAKAVLGNHEFNAIAWWVRKTPDAPDHLRPHSDKNRRQHAAFLDQVGEGSPAHEAWVDWFRGLPLALDLGGIRVVHALWDDAAVAEVEQQRPEGRSLDDDLMHACFAQDSPLKAARKLLTCGFEWDLPEGIRIRSKEGTEHGEARIAAWRHGASRLREVALVPGDNLHLVPDIELPPEVKAAMKPVDGAPVFIGHHWFRGPPAVEGPKVACLDWSAAAGGPLVAYRWDGEAELHNANFVAVGGRA